MRKTNVLIHIVTGVYGGINKTTIPEELLDGFSLYLLSEYDKAVKTLHKL